MSEDKKSIEKSVGGDNNEEKIETAEILEDLPHEARKVIEFGMSMQRVSGRIPNPLLEKINEEHITKILELSRSEDEKSFEFAKQGRLFNLIFVIIFVALFIFLVTYLAKDNSELLKDIIKMVVAAIGGFGAGYGYKSTSNK